MKSIITWFLIVVGVAGLVVAGLWIGGVWQPTSLLPSTAETPVGVVVVAGGAATATTATDAETVVVRPATEVIGQISAAGNIELSKLDYVVLKVGGDVRDVLVQPGDTVQAGDLLLALETTDLERAVMRAQLNVDSAQNDLAQLQQPADANELAQSEAELASAESKLVDAQQPASATEFNAAQASLAAAVAKYSDVTAAKSENELTSLEANLRKAEIALAEAQRNYDQVAWRNDVGMTSQAAELQQASIDHQTAKAEYDLSTEPASQADIQSAYSSIQSAKQTLDDLQEKPNAADIASAEAQVASARANLENLRNGADSLAIEASQLKLKSALIDLEEALSNLGAAQVNAPSAGTVVEVNVEQGLPAQSGATAVTLADLSQLEMTVSVAEVDIDKLHVGQAAEVSIDALPDRQLQGEVARISPVSDSSQSVVSYKVTLRILADQAGDLESVRPDMTAVARMDNPNAANGWLVPSSSLRQVDDGTMVQIVRDGQPTDVTVKPGSSQGEWVVVYSDQLRAGDAVVGTVTSQIGDDQGGFMMGGGGRPPGGGRP